jgi:hypothetical protein
MTGTHSIHSTTLPRAQPAPVAHDSPTTQWHMRRYACVASNRRHVSGCACRGAMGFSCRVRRQTIKFQTHKHNCTNSATPHHTAHTQSIVITCGDRACLLANGVTSKSLSPAWVPFGASAEVATHANCAVRGAADDPDGGDELTPPLCIRRSQNVPTSCTSPGSALRVARAPLAMHCVHERPRVATTPARRARRTEAMVVKVARPVWLCVVWMNFRISDGSILISHNFGRSVIQMPTSKTRKHVFLSSVSVALRSFHGACPPTHQANRAKMGKGRGDYDGIFNKNSVMSMVANFSTAYNLKVGALLTHAQPLHTQHLVATAHTH